MSAIREEAKKGSSPFYLQLANGSQQLAFAQVERTGRLLWRRNGGRTWGSARHSSLITATKGCRGGQTPRLSGEWRGWLK